MEIRENMLPVLQPNGGKEETAKIPPTISDLVVFPSWVEHSVPKQLIEEDRIVVAGNVDVI